MKRSLKAYARLDGTGRVVSSSNILARNKPKVGNWKEIQGYECCNPTTYTTTLTSTSTTTTTTTFPVLRLEFTPIFPIVYVDVVIYCDGLFQGNNIVANTTATNMAELLIILNGNVTFTQFGTYSSLGDVLLLDMPVSVAVSTCAVGPVTFDVSSY